MSIKLFLKVRPRSAPQSSPIKNAELAGDYVVALRADTPSSCLASAAFDAVLKFCQIDNGEDFNVNARDEHGHIVLDTELPAYGALSKYGLSVARAENAAADRKTSFG